MAFSNVDYWQPYSARTYGIWYRYKVRAHTHNSDITHSHERVNIYFEKDRNSRWILTEPSHFCLYHTHLLTFWYWWWGSNNDPDCIPCDDSSHDLYGYLYDRSIDHDLFLDIAHSTSAWTHSPRYFWVMITRDDTPPDSISLLTLMIISCMSDGRILSVYIFHSYQSLSLYFDDYDWSPHSWFFRNRKAYCYSFCYYIFSSFALVELPI